WAGPSKDFAAAMEKVRAALLATGSDDRRAWFACALSLAWPDGHTETVEGQVHGEAVWPPRGGRGFGYDPMFVPDGHALTFGEGGAGWQPSISRRAGALPRLVARCLDGGPGD